MEVNPDLEKTTMRVLVQYRYPGDPVMIGELLWGASFKAMFPDRYTAVVPWHSWDDLHKPVPESAKIPVTEVICDLCNAEVGDHDPCLLLGSYLYCWTCAKEKLDQHGGDTVAVQEPVGA